MNRKAETGQEVLQNELVYLIFLCIFALGISLFLWQQANGAGIAEDYYAKEIAKIINLASIGSEFSLNVHKATEIAQRNHVNFKEIFKFDNDKKEVCVRLNVGRKTCYGYFNDVKVENQGISQASGSNFETNLLNFKILRGEENV